MTDSVNLFGDPIEFNGLLLKPIKMKNYMLFMSVIDVLRLKKNRTPDINVIRMSYIEYLFSHLQQNENGNQFLTMLLVVFKLCLSEKQFKTVEFKIIDGEYFIIYKSIANLDVEDSNPSFINAESFEELRVLILKMNKLRDVDYRMSEETQALLEKARIERARMDGGASLNLTMEDMVDCYHVWTGFSYREIQNEPIYKFIKNVSRMVMIDTYNINKTAEMSGNVKFKKEIEHWLRHIEESDEYEGAKISLNKFVGEFNEKVFNK